MKRILASAIIVLFCSSAFAQSVSVADLRAQIDARVGGLNEYQELLNDPDPARSMAAMEIMMASGDPALVNMAKDYGIFSPIAAVRKAALDGYFASGPLLEMWFDGAKSSRPDNLSNDIEWYSGSTNSESVGYIQIQVDIWDQSKQCFGAVGFTGSGEDDGCFLRNSDNGVSIYLWEKWWSVVLDDQGALVGSGSSRYSHNVPIIIQVAQ